MPDQALAARLRATFIAELQEQVQGMNADLLVLERNHADMERVRSVFRVTHTLKGAARAAGVPIVEQACHALEESLTHVRDGRLVLQSEHFALLFGVADALTDAAARLGRNESLDGAPIATWLHQFQARGGLGAAAPTASPRGQMFKRPHGPPAPSPAAEAPTPPAPSAPAPPLSVETAVPTPVRAVAGVRVNPERLDALAAVAGTLVTSRRTAMTHAEEIDGLRTQAERTAAEWRGMTHRLHAALNASGGAGEAHRLLDGAEEGLRHVLAGVERLATAAARHARALDTTTQEVLQQVRAMRMRPFAEACEALPRVVRDVSQGGKQARLVVEGGDVEADRTVLDGLREALVHVVRNAVDHGIEPSAARKRAGKPEQGTVTVSARLQGDRVWVTVADDGAGIDIAAVRRLLEARGQTPPASDHDVARALFAGGLTTRSEATAISGRGVGMDLVRAAVERVHGQLDVSTTHGKGTTVTIVCPPTLTTVRAVLATVGSQAVAIPSADVERLLRVPVGELRTVEGRTAIVVADEPVPVMPLAQLLPPLAVHPYETHASLVVLRAGTRRLAVTVDTLDDEEELVMQPVVTATGRLPLIGGAAMLGSGGIALLLDAAAAIGAGLQADGHALPSVVVPDAASARKPDAAPIKPRLLVVDDSMTTRTLEQAILEAEGFDVRLAVDGADAWRVLQEHGADLVVSDVEMPRMDGFELCETIRASSRFKHLPVVLVTALETDEHRARGHAAGADAYLGKSSFDQRGLVRTVRELLGDAS